MVRKEKNLIISFVVLIIIIIGICVMMYLEEARIFQIDVSNYEIADEIEYYIDEIMTDEKMLFIRGWAFVPEETIHKVVVYVVLLDEKNNMYYQLPTEMEIRADVSESMGVNSNYDNCGFCSWSKVSKIDYENVKYRVCILYKNDGYCKLIKTNEEI